MDTNFQEKQSNEVMTAPKRLAHLHYLAQHCGVPNLDVNKDFIPQIIVALLNDDSDVVRHEAAFLLGDLQKSKKIPKPDEIHSTLLESLKKDTSIIVVHEAALSLANFPYPITIQELVNAAKKWAASEVTSSVIFSLIDMVEKAERPMP